jgi:hypothetical protein
MVLHANCAAFSFRGETPQIGALFFYFWKPQSLASPGDTNIWERTLTTLIHVWLLSFKAKSKNWFAITRITCLGAMEFVTEFIWNSRIFISCLTLIHVWYPVISVDLWNKMIYHFILFLPNEIMGVKRAVREKPYTATHAEQTATQWYDQPHQEYMIRK